MKLFGLIGYPLTHSWSALYFDRKFKSLHLPDYEYRLFPLRNVNEFSELLCENPQIVGLNVTLPYKISILPFLDQLSPEAREAGAVNCIKVSKCSGNTITKGFNTDVFGFIQSFRHLLAKNHSNALILGTGGASKAVVYALEQLGIQSRLVSRNPNSENSLDYNEVTKAILSEYAIIINATPIGMYPETGAFPLLPYQFIDNRHLLIDLIYNPEETVFLKRGRDAGARTKNGLEMLHLQADQSLNIWLDDSE
jgi:shikimate dehydrogenase